MPTITSRQHPLVKDFHRAARGARDVVLLDGWHLVEDAAAAKMNVEVVAVVDRDSDTASDTIRRLEQAGTRIVSVSSRVMDTLSPVRRPTGVVALARRPEIALDRVLKPAPALVVVAADMQDPGNVGALIRATEAGGATGVVAAGASADPWGWKALRAGMGSTLRLPVRREDDVLACCRALGSAGLAVLACVPRGGDAMEQVDLRSPAALVIGGEGAGLDSAVRDLADRLVTIPMRPPVESLNAAVATALLVYEARRQRAR